MVKISLSYTIDVTNTGVQHDIICGVSLLDETGTIELVHLPWFVIWDVPSGQRYKITISGIGGDIPAGTYVAICRAWTGYTPGTEAGALDSVGVLYQAGTGAPQPPWLDEARQTLVIKAAAVAARIDEFAITV